MKLNNKGYAITIIVFGILIVFIIVLSSLLVTMNNSVKLNKTVKQDVIENIQLGADTTGMSLTERIDQIENSLVQVNEKLSNVKQETINEIYPVGSIYISTTDDSIDDVVARFGGQWERYSQGRTLVGVGTGTDLKGNISTFTVNTTGGEYIHALTINEMPSHNHGIPELQVSSWTGSHTHYLYREFGAAPSHELSPGIETYAQLAGSNAASRDPGTSSISNATINVSGQKTLSSNTTNAGSGTGFSVQNPYITVYMYKRIN